MLISESYLTPVKCRPYSYDKGKNTTYGPRVFATGNAILDWENYIATSFHRFRILKTEMLFHKLPTCLKVIVACCCLNNIALELGEEEIPPEDGDLEEEEVQVPPEPTPASEAAAGLVNSVAVAYHFCLSLPAAFSQPGTLLLAEPCRDAVHSLPSVKFWLTLVD